MHRNHETHLTVATPPLFFLMYVFDALLIRYVGAAVEGKQPTCTHSLDMMDLIKAVQGEVDSLEEGAAELLSATKGNKDALAQTAARSQTLRTAVRNGV